MSWNWHITNVKSIDMLKEDENLKVEEVEQQDTERTIYKVTWLNGEEEEPYLDICDDCVHIFHLSTVLCYLFDKYDCLYTYDDVYDYINDIVSRYTEEEQAAMGVTDDIIHDFFKHYVCSEMDRIGAFDGNEKLQRMLEESKEGYDKYMEIYDKIYDKI